MYLFYVIIFRILIQVFLTLTHKKVEKICGKEAYITLLVLMFRIFMTQIYFPEISISHHSRLPKDPSITCPSAKKNVFFLVHQKNNLPQHPTNIPVQTKFIEINWISSINYHIFSGAIMIATRAAS